MIKGRGSNRAIATGCLVLTAATAAGQVQPAVETEPVPSSGDAADDAAVWVHPYDPGQSVIIATDKDSGLAVYDLAGNELQFLADGQLNNVDVRYGFPLGGALIDIVAASNRGDNRIAVYRLNTQTRQLEDVSAGGFSVGVNEAYGLCLFHSALSGSYYALVNGTDGDVEQWELFDNGRGLVDAVLVRSFSVGSQTEGMVADDEAGWLYVGEEHVAIWRYGAEPDAGNDRVQVDSTSGGQLTADIEGLTIYYASDGGGYLLASSQGSDEFVVYDRRDGNDYIMTFTVESGGGIDAVTGTDGIDVCNVALGDAFPLGVFVAQDDSNAPENQNFKLVPWPDIAETGSLTVDTTWNPRGTPGDVDGDGVVGILDFLMVLGRWGPCPPETCPADLDGDGVVGILDFLIVLGNWG